MTSLASISLAAVCAALSLSLPPQAFATPALGSNLIVNGDAEADVGSLTGASIGAVTGFTLSGDFTVIQYNAGGGYPGSTDPGPTNRGANFFGGGFGSPSVGEQIVGIADLAGTIDTGRATYDLSAYLGGYASQDDNAVLPLTFVDASSTALGSASIGPVTVADRASLTGLSFREASGAVPQGTRSVVVDLRLTRVEGSSNDGYADNLSLVLEAPTIAPAVPEPQSWALLVAGLGTIVTLGRRGRAPR